MKGRYYIWFFTLLLFSCHRKGNSLVHEYSYAGISKAESEQVAIVNNVTNTIAWDTSYQDKIKVTYNDDFTTLTFNVSHQTHSCQTFQETFTFPTNHQNVYTANSDTMNASQTFEISSDTLYGYMLKQVGNDSNYATYTLSFKGNLIQ